jgi:hypothetical protein
MKAFSRHILTGTLVTSFLFGFVGIIHNQAYAAVPTQNLDKGPSAGGNGSNNQPGFPGQRGNARSGFQGGNVLKETAALLGVEQTTITDALKEGKTYLQIAAAAGLTEELYLQKLVNAITLTINAELTAGTITQAQADQQKSGLAERLKQQIDNKVSGNLQQGPGTGKGTEPQDNGAAQEPRPANGKASSVTGATYDHTAGYGKAGTVTDATYDNTDGNLIDIDGHWAFKNIKNLIAKGILQGDGNKHFNPDKSVTREELATMVAKSFNLSSVSSAKPNYSDVSQSRWSYQHVEATKEYFDSKSDTNGALNFNPTEAAKREDVAMTLVKVLLKKDASLSLLDTNSANQLLQEKFKDADSIPAALRVYVATAVQSNLIQGDDQGNFAPVKTITRAEVAALLDRVLGDN